MTVYIKGATFVDWQDLSLKKTHIAVEEGKTGGITPVDAIPTGEGIEIIDAGGRIVTRSFGCGHHHIYSTLARGMPAPAKVPENFLEILRYVWWNIDKKLDLDMIRASALASALYCAKNGVTFVIDHHASPFATEGSLFAIKEAFDKVGISHLLCYEISDRDGEAIREAGLAETRAYLDAGNQGHVGLHTSFTVGDDALGSAVALGEKCRAGIHIHAAEDPADQEHCLKHHGRRVVERLSRSGALSLPGTILAHCLHLEEGEKALLRDSGAWVVQNVESNLNNNVGLTGYTDHGPNIMLGTDGMHSDMLRSAKSAFFVGRITEGIGFPEIYRRFRNIHRYTSAGGFSGDGENNLVILDYDPPTEVTGDNFLGHFVFGIESAHVDTVISSGRPIVAGRRLLFANGGEILSFAREMGARLWEKLP